MASTYEDTSLTLIFTPDNPTNTTITDAKDGAVLYQIVTEFKYSQKETKVLSAAGETLASWVWKHFSSDNLTLGKAAPVSMNTWLRKSLYSKDESRSIATFFPSRCKRSLRFTVVGNRVQHTIHPAKLVVDAQGKEVSILL
ncbi:hypothetical protein BDP27DRAFT_1374533 [Rhodocollybia butyracea]|uniref:DUF6593 domain-containing protein n=1 Tax=Rhodocollybia butyracea TaxID=206335 RepID=A0A9P5P5D9_9AGAR|nr:hypothetical protein BDP27DRAFT_1374533 [Rhodocollybia butyracea]